MGEELGYVEIDDEQPPGVVTVTVPPGIVTVPPGIVTVPPGIVTVPPGTVTVSPGIVTVMLIVE